MVLNSGPVIMFHTHATCVYRSPQPIYVRSLYLTDALNKSQGLFNLTVQS